MKSDASVDICVDIAEELDILACRKAVRDAAIKLGFGITDQTRLVTATSELSRNIVNFAGSGKMYISAVSSGSMKGMKVVFEDHGPGLDAEEAMTFGFSTGGGLGAGLPGAKKLVDEFELRSEEGVGTTVTISKWVRQ